MNNYHTVSMYGLSGKKKNSDTLIKCLPGYCDCVPMTFLGRLTYQMRQIVHMQVTCLRAK